MDHKKSSTLKGSANQQTLSGFACLEIRNPRLSLALQPWVLRSLPKKHPRRARILAGYRTMMASLLKYQGADGLWRQLIDRPESWAETSSTGKFTFAMVTGVKNGWLPPKAYGPAARKAWLGLVGHIDAQANVTDVCVGTNKAHAEVGTDRDTQLKYYLDRTRRTGDLHGQAPVLWTATALLR